MLLEFQFAKIHLFPTLPKKNVTLHSVFYYMTYNKEQHINNIDHPTIVTVGMFDGVHTGHQHILDMLLRTAATERLTPVVVTFDNHPRLVLGKTDERFHLLSTNEERRQLLERHGIVNIDWIHFTREEASLSACQFVRQHLLQRLHAKAIVIGYDNQFGNKQHNDFDQLPDLALKEGFKIFRDTPVLVDGIEVSSTQIRNALMSGDLPLANKMLGTPYAVSGTVSYGRQVGRTLGFPTANIVLDNENKALPKEGVYAAIVVMADGSEHKGMVNIGPQPTFGQTTPTIEVHILDCHSDLYGQRLTIRFIQRLRDIRQFPSPNELMVQLQHDMDAVAQM